MIAALLFAFALVMYAVDRTARLDREMDQLTWLDALLVGVAQAVALAPGVSRSGRHDGRRPARCASTESRRRGTRFS